MENWRCITSLEEIPRLGARVVTTDKGNIALFRTAENDVFALYDKCPHKGGSLSQGIVHGKMVTCPLHGWNIDLENGHAVAPDKGCANKVACKVENGDVFLYL